MVNTRYGYSELKLEAADDMIRDIDCVLDDVYTQIESQVLRVIWNEVWYNIVNFSSETLASLSIT